MDKKFSQRIVYGDLAIVPVVKPYKKQILLYKSNTLVRIIAVFKNKTALVENIKDCKNITVKWGELSKCVMHVKDRYFCNSSTMYDVNITKYNISQIQKNINKKQYGILQCIDTILPKVRFDSFGMEKPEFKSKGYRFFIRLVDENRLKEIEQRFNSGIRVRMVNKAFRAPDKTDDFDANASLNGTKLCIVGSMLEGIYEKIK